MWNQLLAVGVGGAIGAVLRWLISTSVHRLLGTGGFPYGTLTVNVLGSFALGWLMAQTGDERWIASPTARAVLGIGLLGAFTTFSTFSVETLDALRGGAPRIALANVAVSVVAALGACWAGLSCGARLGG